MASDKDNITDSSILRTYVYGKIAEWESSATQAMEVVCKVYEVLQDDQVSLQGFINREKQNGQWRSTLDMAFASLVLNVNIISLSNILKRFEVFSTIDLFQHPAVQLSVPMSLNPFLNSKNTQQLSKLMQTDT